MSFDPPDEDLELPAESDDSGPKSKSQHIIQSRKALVNAFGSIRSEQHPNTLLAVLNLIIAVDNLVQAVEDPDQRATYVHELRAAREEAYAAGVRYGSGSVGTQHDRA